MRSFLITIQTKKTGIIGEDIACDYLQKIGYKILERNIYFSKNCEIDIIAKDNDTIVFVEVKTRKSLGYGHPFEAINKTKLQKIIYGVLTYCSANNITKYRIDGIGIIGLKNPKIEHLKNLGF
ncbi:YraN family protein [bacterium]|nr:YraN family protein [bacterium]